MGQLLKKIPKMILSLVFFCFCGIVTCSPVSEVEDRGLVGDIAMGILVGKIQEMLGITTTPKPRPVLDSVFSKPCSPCSSPRPTPQPQPQQPPPPSVVVCWEV